MQDITQLNTVYGKENAIMANCHTRIAYAPNTVETADILSKMTGTTTVVEEKRSISGTAWERRNITVNISETSRPLLTADECMRLPSAEKDAQGRVTKPGHMLIFTAGKSPIYGCQILYFHDAVFSKRAKIHAPGVSTSFPSGITDSLYFPRPKDWYGGEKIQPSDLIRKEENNEEYTKDFASFMQEGVE